MGAEFAVYSEINTKQIQCGQKFLLLNVKPVGASRDQQALKG